MGLGYTNNEGACVGTTQYMASLLPQLLVRAVGADKVFCATRAVCKFWRTQEQLVGAIAFNRSGTMCVFASGS